MTEVVRIDALDDPLLSDYVGVRDPARLLGAGGFLAEGRLVVETLLSRSPLRARSVLGTPATLEWFESRGLAIDGPFLVVEPATMEGLAGLRFHQGCIAAGDCPAPTDAAALVADTGHPGRIVVLDTVTNPDNVGAIFRTADAFEAGCVVLTARCASPLYRKAIRASMGASLTLPFCHADDGPGTVRALQSAGYAVLAFSPDDSADPLDAVVAEGAAGRSALMFGSEGYGLDPATRDLADRNIVIPIAPQRDSLNVAAAVAVALYALRAP